MRVCAVGLEEDMYCLSFTFKCHKILKHRSFAISLRDMQSQVAKFWKKTSNSRAEFSTLESPDMRIFRLDFQNIDYPIVLLRKTGGHTPMNTGLARLKLELEGMSM
jgi:hypothetical protein